MKTSPKLWKLFKNLLKYVVSPLFIILLCFIYLSDKNWLLNNIFGLYLTITGVKYGGVTTFKLILPILWLLFLYDMFWVYGTDVMVTVAKSIDLPLKLQFPYLNMVG